eukprot:scaffold91482_cov33-Tisochrysis_lutea.AAC.1
MSPHSRTCSGEHGVGVPGAERWGFSGRARSARRAVVAWNRIRVEALDEWRKLSAVTWLLVVSTLCTIRSPDDAATTDVQPT